MIRVLVAEDSTTTRELLVAILRADPEVEVVGQAKNGMEAVAMTKALRPDVVTMDIRMPLMDGFEATKQIMVETPTPIVIVSASVDVREVEISMHALRLGALTLIAKPDGPSSPAFEALSRQFLVTVKSMSKVRVVRRWPERATPVERTGTSELKSRARIVALAASTGGPGALCRVLSELPGDFPIPVLVIQHIAEGFLQGFASWLNTNTKMRVKIAENGESLEPRMIYVPPDDRHLGVEGTRTIVISNAPPIAGFRPSATFLYDSVARAFGDTTLAVIMTGMGQDGLDGLKAVRRAGGQVIAQDEETSVVFGMPGAAVQNGLANVVAPLPAIASQVMRAVRSEGGPL